MIDNILAPLGCYVCMHFRMATGLMTVKTRPNPSNWSMEAGYKYDYGDIEYPNRVPETGWKYGLDLILSVNKRDHDPFCEIGASGGFDINIEAPVEMTGLHNYFGRDLQYFRRIKLFTDHTMKIKATLFDISDGLSKYKPEQRECYLNSDRSLRFFKTYTMNNCNWECKANYTKQECDCVRFDMPSMYLDCT